MFLPVCYTLTDSFLIVGLSKAMLAICSSWLIPISLALLHPLWSLRAAIVRILLTRRQLRRFVPTCRIVLRWMLGHLTLRRDVVERGCTLYFPHRTTILIHQICALCLQKRARARTQMSSATHIMRVLDLISLLIFHGFRSHFDND